MTAQTKQLTNRLPYTPALKRYGLLLVLIPGLLGTLLLLFFNHRWLECGKVTTVEQQRCQLISQVNTCFADLASFGFNLMVYCAIGDERFHQRLEDGKGKLKISIDRLQAPQADERSKALLEKLQMTAHNAIVDADSMASSLQSSYLTGGIARFKGYNKIMQGSIDFTSIMQQLVDEQQSHLRTNQSNQETAFLQLRWLTVAIFVIGMLLLLCLLLFAARETILRLRAVCRNAAALADHNRVETRVRGNDEFAYLDSVFNQVASELAHAREHRKSVLQMIAHDMRSPMMAAHVYLETFETLAEDTLSKEGKQACLVAQKACDSILEFGTDLIALEQLGTDSASGVDSDDRKSSVLRLSGNFLQSATFKNGLVVVAVALLLQFVWLVGMTNQLARAEELSRLIYKQTEAVIGINRLWSRVFNADYGVAFYLISGKPYLQDIANASMRDAQREVEKLSALLPDSPEKDKLIAGLNDLFPTLRQALASKSEKEGPFGLNSLPSMSGRAQAFNIQLQEIAAQEETKLAQTRVKQEQMRDFVQHIIVLAIAITLLASYAILLAMTRLFTRRVEVLVDVARSLPSRAVIVATVSGNDEIALLYKLLCQASADLKAADEKRRSLIELVSNFIAAPSRIVEEAMPVLEENCTDATPPKARECLDAARLNIRRVAELTNDLITMDNFEIGKIELSRRQCKLQEICNEVMASAASLAQRRKISLDISCQSDLDFSLDYRLIVRVLINLITNAIKFSPEGSSIRLSITKSGGHLDIAVEDKGKGMDEITVQHVFDKYYRAPGQTETGFGLGLTFCKQVVEAHGGTITCASKVNEGTTFSIAIPG
jgi:signal transduction histidine kinase